MKLIFNKTWKHQYPWPQGREPVEWVAPWMENLTRRLWRGLPTKPQRLAQGCCQAYGHPCLCCLWKPVWTLRTLLSPRPLAAPPSPEQGGQPHGRQEADSADTRTEATYLRDSWSSVRSEHVRPWFRCKIFKMASREWNKAQSPSKRPVQLYRRAPISWPWGKPPSSGNQAESRVGVRCGTKNEITLMSTYSMVSTNPIFLTDSLLVLQATHFLRNLEDLPTEELN